MKNNDFPTNPVAFAQYVWENIEIKDILGGLHTYYNGCQQREAKPRGRANLKNTPPVQIAGCNPPA